MVMCTESYLHTDKANLSFSVVCEGSRYTGFIISSAKRAKGQTDLVEAYRITSHFSNLNAVLAYSYVQ